jgi:hypothetical protein
MGVRPTYALTSGKIRLRQAGNHPGGNRQELTATSGFPPADIRSIGNVRDRHHAKAFDSIPDI